MKDTFALGWILSLSMIACSFGAEAWSNDSSVVTERGTVGGVGGGDLLKSSPEQVKESIAKQRQLLKKAFSLLEIVLKDMRDQEDKDLRRIPPELAAVLSDVIFGNRFNSIPAAKLLDEVAMLPNESEPCEASDKKHNAASVLGPKSLCLSIPYLRVLAPQDLDLNILALLIHEFTHLYGYDDTHAVNIQEYLAANDGLIMPSPTELRHLVDLLMDWQANTALAREQLTNDVNDAGICSTITVLDTQMVTFFKRYRIGKPTLWLPKQLTDSFRKATASYYLNSQKACASQKEHGSKQMSAADRAPLVVSFQKMSEANDELAHTLSSYMGRPSPRILRTFGDVTHDLYAPAMQRFYSSNRSQWPAPLQEKDIVCTFEDLQISDMSQTGSPSLVIHEDENGKIVHVKRASADGGARVIFIGLRSQIINKRQMGYQLMLTLSGGMTNADLRIEAVKNAKMVDAINDHNGNITQVPTALLMRGISDSFQVDFSTPGLRSTERDGFVIACKIQK